MIEPIHVCEKEHLEIVDKINEIVGKVNTLGCDLQKNTDARPLSEEHRFGEWVSAKDMLPPQFESVLVVMPGEAPFPLVHQGFVDKYNVWFANGFRREKDEITHWMPMPNPPEEFTTGLLKEGMQL